MKSFAILSILVVSAVAQSSTSTSAASASTANPLIPAGISPGCSSYLTTLNADAGLANCISPIISATSQFGPSADGSSAPSDSTVASALSQLCTSSATASCTDAVRGHLASFYSSCTEELTGASRSNDVLRLYDVLYTINPLQTAVCSKDESGKFCITQISAGGTPGTARLATPELVENNLWTEIGGGSGAPAKRAQTVDNVNAALVPNMTTFRESGIPFLFLTPGLDASKLCTSCTRSVLTAYIAFEQSVPYAPGLQSSLMLGGQPELYQAINSTCGPNFMSGAVQAAGGLAGGLLSGAEKTIAGGLNSAGTLLAAVAVGFAAVL